MDGLIKLNPFALEPEAYRGFLFRYKIGALIPQFFVIVLLAVLEFIITQNVLASVGLAVYLEFLSILSRWSTVRKAVRNPLNRGLWTNRMVEFDSNTLWMASSNGTSSQVPFRNFGKVDLFGGYFLLYLTTVQIITIPENAFRSESDKKAFVDILNQNNLLKQNSKK